LADSKLQALELEAPEARPWFYFDPDYYVAQCIQSGATPQLGTAESYLRHYLTKGAAAGLSPNPFFDEDYYRRRHRKIATAITAGRWSSGFEHFTATGAAADLSPVFFFDGLFYKIKNPDLTDENLRNGKFDDRYAHYLRVGIDESRIGHWTVQALRTVHPAFPFPRNRVDLARFLLNSPRLVETFAPIFEFEWMKEKYGWGKNIRPEGFLRHYLLNVKSGALSPSPYFEESFYLANLPEVREAVEKDSFSCGYEHYMLHGMAEGRKPSSTFDPHYYYEKNIAPNSNWLDEQTTRVSFLHFLRNKAAKRLTVAPPLIGRDVPEDMGKAVYERRCAQNAGLLGSMTFSDAAVPDVSVIIVARDGFEQTANCIITLLCNTKANVEMILFDNGSTDETSRIPDINPGIKYIAADSNLGFTIAVNRAAKLATGRVILLLNNDVEVAPLAVDRALARLDGDRTIGAVGAKIIRMHGRLQEAGSIIWQDGSCIGYARDADPRDGQVNFARDVDFCSGCFLAIMRQDWEALNGFDPAYAPAYYEETDLCLRIWESGQRVVYDPQVVVWHFEYGSSAFQEEALALIRKNQRYFATKHSSYLTKCFPANDYFVERARLRYNAGPRVLFIEDMIPDPMKGMGFVRSASVARTLAGLAGLVSILGLHSHYWHNAAADFGDLPVEILTNFNVNNMGKLLRERTGVYDILWLSRTHNLMHLKGWVQACPEFFSGVKVVLDTEAVAALRTYTYAARAGQAANLPAMVQEEFEHLENIDHICAVSELDQQLLRDALQRRGLPIPISILGHSIPVWPEPPRFDDTQDIVLFGSYSQPDSPNVDAVLWFDQLVRPLLQEMPRLRFCIAGSDAGLFAKAGRLQQHYHVIDNPTRLADVYRHARLMVAPTRFAAGIPMKVHDAASYGVPVVMSDLLADQLGWRQHGAGVNVANPEDFARAVMEMALDRELWTKTQALQLRLVAAECDPAVFSGNVAKIVGDLTGVRREN
jgi:GT2 family glycosyltransferase